MSYGITTGRAHLNKLQMMYQSDAAIPGFTGPNPTPGFAAELDALDTRTGGHREIDWSVFADYMNSADGPAFAGRYFHGQATAQEVTEDEAFCIWAHGEGNDAEVPDKIFVIQRANARWQAVTTRRDARRLAEMEARATLRRVEEALRVGDLWCHGMAATIVVYLETAPGQLSPQYWRYWARTVLSHQFDHPTGDKIAPFVPGIICDYVETEPGSGSYWPEAAVRLALGAAPYVETEGDTPPGDGDFEDPGLEAMPFSRSIYQPVCFSLWARNMPEDGDIPALFAIRWLTTAAELTTHFIRVWDCHTQDLPDDPVLTEAQRNILAIVTIDKMVANLPENALDWTLRPVDWRINAPQAEGVYGPGGTFEVTESWSSEGELLTPPTQFGLDHLSPATAAVYAQASQTEVEVRLLPDNSYDNGGGQPVLSGTDFTHDPLIFLPSFTGRYLPPKPTSLSAAEVEHIAASGLQIVSLYQQAADPTGTNLPNLRMSDASMRQAFENAMRFGQPPFTPVYFAVDVDVDGNNWKDTEWRTDPDGTVHDDGPSFQAILDFYRRVRRVYTQDYLTQDGAVPYHIGAYAPIKVMHALYRAGLATHFWQSMAHTFGRPVGLNFSTEQWRRWYCTSPGWRAWPHANLWQIRLAGASDTGFWTWPRNAVLTQPPFPQDAEAASWCDINVAWGNPGGWVPDAEVLKGNMPVLPPADTGGAGV